MTITRQQIADLLRPGLDAIFSDDVQYPTQWTEIFDVHNSDMSYEVDVEMKPLGLAQMRPEGAATALDDMGQRIVTHYVHKTYGLGLVITRNCIRDNLYKNKFPMYAKALRNSLAQRKERMGASILNNGFDPNYPVGDGQSLFSANHPIDGGTYSNTGVGIQLSQSALEDAITNIQQFKNQAGLISMTQPTKLIVPPAQQWIAAVILKSAYVTGQSAANDINPLFNLSAIPQGYRVNQFLTNPKSWFILTDATDGFKHFVREKPETDVYVDWATDNLMAKVIESYSFGVSNPRASWGNLGA
jgi:hypothetical protein